jgi:hypothetical protein
MHAARGVDRSGAPLYPCAPAHRQSDATSGAPLTVRGHGGSFKGCRPNVAARDEGAENIRIPPLDLSS